MSESFSETLRARGDAYLGAHIRASVSGRDSGTLPCRWRSFATMWCKTTTTSQASGRWLPPALSKAPDTPTLRRLTKHITTPVERPLHAKMFDLLEMREADAEDADISPTNRAYVNHMRTAAQLGGVGEAAAALLPCPWTYHEIGARLTVPNHPIYEYWAAAYRDGLLEESTAAWRELVDEFAATGGSATREAMRNAFIISSRYEFMFWSMAYDMEHWPV